MLYFSPMKMLAKRGLFLHVILWVAYFILLIFWLAIPFTYETAIWHALRMLVIHIAIFYVNTQLLLPLLTRRNSWTLYLLCFAGLLVVVYFYFDLTTELMPYDRFDTVSDTPTPPRNIRSFRTRWIIQYMFMAFGVLFVSSVQFLRAESAKRREIDLQRNQEQLTSEMRFLRSQINPHFLFNALNNIYALAVNKNPETPALIMKLSLMLRYVLYETNVEYVPVQKEWEYIRNFIDLQKVKFEEDINLEIETDLEEDMTISPMILLPFVENAFKHSYIEDTDHGWIKILLKTSPDGLHFRVSNSTPEKIMSKDKEGGIGLTNVGKRLNLLYPDSHKLKIIDNTNSFTIDLEILNK